MWFKAAWPLASGLLVGLLWQVAEPSIPLIWALLVTVVFVVLLVAISLISPLLANRPLQLAQREYRQTSRERIDELEDETRQLRGRVDDLQRLLRESQSLADRLAFDLEKAQERIIELEQRHVENSDHR